MEKTKKLSISGSTLKWIAIITMLIDHIAASFYIMYIETNNLTGAPVVIYEVMRCIGRIAFPIFIFLLIEGFTHTRNVGKYMLRLFLFALISEVPFDLAFMHEWYYPEYQNVFFTLFLGLLSIWLIRQIEEKWYEKKWLIIPAILGILSATFLIAKAINNFCYMNIPVLMYEEAYYPIFLVAFIITTLAFLILYLMMRIKKSATWSNAQFSKLFAIVVGMAAAIYLRTDYAEIGVLAIIVMYRLRAKQSEQFILGTAVLMLSSVSEVCALVALLPIKLYNGTRGRQMKYFFYLFYPIHLLILGLLWKWYSGTL